MALSQSQKSLVQKARVLGVGLKRVSLDYDICSYLVGVVAEDLGVIGKFPEFTGDLPSFYSNRDIRKLKVSGVDFDQVVERLFHEEKDADTYFLCLANIHKRRLKYQQILQTQPVPMIEQVGHRGILQFGSMSPRALMGLLFWRKWIYDIDNRAAQETGYLFEPIIAHAIGGTPVSANQSPIKREGDGTKGRQVDCIVGNYAYEFKIRVTIAASGQGRWKEEMSFPKECQLSGYKPVLIVLDPTPSDKLKELSDAFKRESGEVYTGSDAWRHLGSMAGDTMSKFLAKYVRDPMDTLLAESVNELPKFCLELSEGKITITVGDEQVVVSRDSRNIEN